MKQMPEGTENIPDWELVNYARNGNNGAFEELVKRYQIPITHFCYRMLGSIEEAEDVAQDCFIRLYKNLHRLTPRAKFSTVLFGIARNLTLNAIRDAERRGKSKTQSLTKEDEKEEWSVPDKADNPAKTAQLHELETLIQEGLKQLSPEHREILLLREMEKLDYEEIAQIIGIRIGTVKSRLARAREQLRNKLIQMGGLEIC